MSKPLKAFRDDYLDLLVRFLWREWTALGVAGRDTEPPRHIVDPEALLLFTCSIGRYDQRLFDEVLDWLVKNGRFINVQRLRNLLNAEAFQGGDVLCAIADWLARNGDPLKWNVLRRRDTKENSSRSLFFLKNGRPMPASAKTDAIFIEHGFIRNPIAPRGYSSIFPNDTLPCHFLKMRAMFGVAARADIVTYLAANGTGHPREIAQELHYSQKTVHDAMTDMACSGVLHSSKGARERVFRIAAEGTGLLSGDMKGREWINWPIALSAAETVWHKTETLLAAPLEPLVEASELELTLRPVMNRLARMRWMPVSIPHESPKNISLLNFFGDTFRTLQA